MSLEAVHVGLIWTAIVLIVAVLLYYFINDYGRRKFMMMNRPVQSQATNYSNGFKHPKPMVKPHYMPQYKNNRKISIAVIACSWVLPLIINYFTPGTAYYLTGALGIAGICNAIVTFILVAAIICGSKYVRHRKYKINSLLLNIYAGAMFIYGLYVAYNVINVYLELS